MNADRDESETCKSNGLLRTRRVWSDSRVPVGERYSQVYLTRGQPTRDSERLRKRLGMFARQIFSDVAYELAIFLEREMGVDVPYAAGQRSLEEFFRTSVLQDVLDACTLCYEFAGAVHDSGQDENWLNFVRRAMHEENVGYRVDDGCGIHPLVDYQFEADRVAAIAALQGPRYTAVLDAFEEAHRAIEEMPPNGKMGVRHTFEAAEILFKLLCGTTKVQVLGTDEVRGHLEPIVQRVYGGTPTLGSAAARFTTSFKDWVSAAHPFRHGQMTEMPLTVPLDLAVAMMASGASFIRWLAEIDRASYGAGPSAPC